MRGSRVLIHLFTWLSDRGPVWMVWWAFGKAIPPPGTAHTFAYATEDHGWVMPRMPSTRNVVTLSSGAGGHSRQGLLSPPIRLWRPRCRRACFRAPCSVEFGVEYMRPAFILHTQPCHGCQRSWWNLGPPERGVFASVCQSWNRPWVPTAGPEGPCPCGAYSLVISLYLNRFGRAHIVRAPGMYVFIILIFIIDI